MIKERIILSSFFSIILIVLAVVFVPKAETYKIKYDKFWAYKSHRQDKFDIICLGDSRAYRGLSPEEMNKELKGLRILNFGFSSGRLDNFMYRQAEKRLDMKSNNKIIILAISPNALTVHPKENEQLKSLLKLPRDEVFSRIYLSPITSIFQPLKFRHLFKKPEPTNYQEIFHNNGWVESYKIIDDTSGFKSYRNWFAKTKISEKLVNNLLEQTTKWTQNGIKVIGFRMPSCKIMEEIEDSIGGYNNAAIKKSIVQAGGNWIETSSDGYRSYDGSHLHKESALKFSHYIAAEIKKILNQKN